ncbi:sugar transporter domain-containing protein [Ditylenchus destructor]|uniref:Sugar transporter domain-containing protein n=1 Tax=Ditylenchus destructor TaxID=166010 RepID=A0AAD4MYE4_9BILA|nr:sugar transporter domain-containing protein [Ditylenchus destructor]
MTSLFPNANRFHLLLAICFQFTTFFDTQLIFPIFSSYVPRWRCSNSKKSNLGDASTSFGRDCKAFQECSAPNSIQFEHIYFESAALEFDWVCGSRAYLSTLFPQVQFVGVFLGVLAFGSLSDHIGRRPVGIGALFVGITMTVLSGLSPTWKVLFACRFCVGLSIGALTAIKTFVMEMVLPEQRIYLQAFFNWGNARIMLTLICFLFPNWRTASIICAICVLPALYLMMFVLPESTTWLHHKGKLEQMRANERIVAKIAGTKYKDAKREAIIKQSSFLDLMRNREFMQRLGVLWVMWFVASVSSYGTDLNSSRIVGNLFLNQALLSTIIALSRPLLIPFDAFNFNRRNLHQYAQTGMIICFLMLAYLALFGEQGSAILIVNLLAVTFLEYSWDGCVLCAIESTPTEMRVTALGTCSLIARIGAILSPMLAFLNTIWAPSAYLVLASLGSISLLVSCLWLVDTRGVNLDKVDFEEEKLLHDGDDCKHKEEETNSFL